MYINIHVYLHVNVHIYTYVYTHICVWVYARVCMKMYPTLTSSGGTVQSVKYKSWCLKPNDVKSSSLYSSLLLSRTMSVTLRVANTSVRSEGEQKFSIAYVLVCVCVRAPQRVFLLLWLC